MMRPTQPLARRRAPLPSVVQYSKEKVIKSISIRNARTPLTQDHVAAAPSEALPLHRCGCPHALFTPWAAAQPPATSPAVPLKSFAVLAEGRSPLPQRHPFAPPATRTTPDRERQPNAGKTSQGGGGRVRRLRPSFKKRLGTPHARRVWTEREVWDLGSAANPCRSGGRHRKARRSPLCNGTYRSARRAMQEMNVKRIKADSCQGRRSNGKGDEANGVLTGMEKTCYVCNVCFGSTSATSPHGTPVLVSTTLSYMEKASTTMSSVIDSLFPKTHSGQSDRTKTSEKGGSSDLHRELNLSATQKRLSVYLQQLSPVLRLIGLKSPSTSRSSSGSAFSSSRTNNNGKSSLSTSSHEPPKRHRLRAVLSFGKKVHAQVHASNLSAVSLLSTAAKLSGLLPPETPATPPQHRSTALEQRPSLEDPAVLKIKKPNLAIPRVLRQQRARRIFDPTSYEMCVPTDGKGPFTLSDRYALYTMASDAVRYAVAVYGEAYEQGLLNSLRQGVLLFTHPTYQRLNYASARHQRTSVERMLCRREPFTAGMPPSAEVIHQFYNQDDVVQSSSYILCADHAQKRVVLSFRGTATLSDAVGCVRDGYATVELLCGAEERSPLRTKVPLGFYRLVLSQANVILPQLRSLAAQYPAYDLVLTGHSLGGIQATLFHLLLCLPLPSCAVVDASPSTPASSASTAGKSLRPEEQRQPLPHLFGDSEGVTPRGEPKRTADVQQTSVSTPPHGSVTSHPPAFRSVQSFAFAPAPTIEVEAAAVLKAHFMRRSFCPLNSSRGVTSGAVRNSANSLAYHRLVTFCHGVDIVPRLQSWSVRAFLLQQPQAECQAHQSREERGSSAHVFGSGSPLRAVRRSVATALSGPQPSGAAHLCIPGEVFFLSHTGKCGGVSPAPLQDPAREDISLLTKWDVSVLDVLRHHLPGTYLRRLQAEQRFYEAQWQRRQLRGAISLSSRPSRRVATPFFGWKGGS